MAQRQKASDIGGIAPVKARATSELPAQNRLASARPAQANSTARLMNDHAMQRSAEAIWACGCPGLIEQRTGHHQGILAPTGGRIVVASAADFIEAVTLVEAVGTLVAGTHFEEALARAELAGALHQVLQ